MHLHRSAIALALTVFLFPACGGSSNSHSDEAGSAGAGAAAGAERGGTAGTHATGGSGATAGHAAGVGGGGRGGSTNGGSSGGNLGGGTSGNAGSEDGGAAGEPAVQCTGPTLYFPEFDRTCTMAEDCVAVAHQTSCCGDQSVMGIRGSELAAFEAAEATCDDQYPACGCAARGVAVEDGTLLDFAWQDQVEVSCDDGTCRAHYSGVSFACGTIRCTEQQYCVEASGGPAGTPTSFSCNPTACTDCSCLTMAGCSCTDADGHLKMTCQYP